MNRRDELFQEYQKMVTEKQKNDHRIELDQKNLAKLKQEQKKAVENAHINNEAQITELNKQVSEKRSDAEQKKRQIQKVSGEFDFDSARKAFDAETEVLRQQEMAELSAQRDKVREQLQRCRPEMEAWIKREQNVVEDDSELMVKIENLKRKQQEETLPKNITDQLNEQGEEALIRKFNIRNGKDITVIGNAVRSLDSLIEAVPEWKSHAFGACAFLSGVLSGILAYLISTILGGGVGSAAAGAANGVVVLIQKIMISLSGMIVGGIIGVIIGVLLFFFVIRGQVKMIWGGAIAGGVIGAVTKFRSAYASGISDGTMHMVGNTTKIIFMLIIWVIILWLMLGVISGQSLHLKMLEQLLTIPFFQKKALAQQAHALDTYVDNYCIVIRYQEILNTICMAQGTAKQNQLSADLAKLENQLQNKEGEFQALRQSEKEKTIMLQKEKFDDRKNQKISENKRLEEEIQKANAEIDELNSQINFRRTNLQKIVEQEKRSYQQKIDKCEQTLQKEKAENKNLLEKLKGVIAEFKSCTMPEIVETCGRLSDVIYWNQPGDQEIADIRLLRHDQQPMLFLYSADAGMKEERKVDKVYDMIKGVLFEFFYNNSIEVLGFNIVDNYKKAIDLQSQSDFHCYDDKNISELYEKVESVVNNVAIYGGGKTWNDVIAAEVEKSGLFDKYKCQVTAILVPPERLVKTQFRGELWQLVRMGKEKGFIPLFFVDEGDYRNFDPEKNSGSVIEKIQQLFEEKNHIYRINLETGEIA